jgi:membrane protease subunit (stomatin/prohibitin family)
MDEITNTLHNMQEQLAEAIDNARKFDAGNNSAGTRVRKAMQNIKSLAQSVRLEVQAQKNGVPA